MPHLIICDLCGRQIERHASYTVKFELFADPSMPDVTSEELAETDYDQMAIDLINEMNGMSADDLQDDVHRMFEFHVCRPCQRILLANPLGRPRRPREGQN